MLETVLKIFSEYSLEIDSSNLNGGCGLLAVDNNQIHTKFSSKHFSTDTPAAISSLTKPILAFALNSLEENIFDSEIRQYLPDFSNSDLKVIDLVNHLSGIPEYIYSASERVQNSWSLDQACEFVKNQEIATNRQFSYSNSNYLLLSKIYEILEKESYFQALRKNIFFEYEMLNTFTWDELELKKSPLPAQYQLKQGKLVKIVPCRAYMGWGDASIVSSLNDLGKLFFGNSFSDYTKKAVNDAGHLSYLNGLYVQDSKSGKLAFHSGSTLGAESIFVINLSLNYSFIFLSNIENLDSPGFTSRLTNEMSLNH